MEVSSVLAGADIPGYFPLERVYIIQNWAFVAGVLVTLAAVYFWRSWHWIVPAVWKRLKGSAAPSKETTRTVAALLLVVFLFAATATVTLAQTATPVPPTATSTPGLTIPINTVMTSTNSWIETFAPIAAIGIGIGIALAILGYLGRIIRSAFN